MSNGFRFGLVGNIGQHLFVFILIIQLLRANFEFGKLDGKIVLMDEIHTPDSSRYFFSDGFEGRQARGERQLQLSKEFVREWLMANGFQGLEGQTMPIMDDAFVNSITERYEELFKAMTGNALQRRSYDNVIEDIEKNINQTLKNL